MKILYTTIRRKINYLYEQQIVTEHQKLQLLKTTAFIQAVSLIDLIIGMIFIGGSINIFFLVANSHTGTGILPFFLQNNIFYFFVLITEWIFIIGFFPVILVLEFIFLIKWEILCLYIFLCGIMFFILGILLPFYQELLIKIHIVCSIWLWIFFPVGMGLSLFELCVLTRPELDIIFGKSSEALTSELVVDRSNEIARMSPKKIIIKHIYTLNILVLAVYGLVALNYLFNHMNYYASFINNLYDILGLIIIGISVPLFIINEHLYKYKTLSVKTIIFATITQLVVIPILIGIEFISFDNVGIKLLIIIGLMVIYVLAAISSKKLIDLSMSIKSTII